MEIIAARKKEIFADEVKVIMSKIVVMLITWLIIFLETSASSWVHGCDGDIHSGDL